jgi:HD-GYP domain-containing protein (c-di-GMP phosphodiesterase class II)
LLHDIGNIAVPASILAKPAPLTETELALMRTHVEEGCQLLADIDLGGPVADIVYQSHERYDGSGYPRGLKGEEILTEARILAIADTVEAMCSSRPYRPAVSVAAALDEINRAAGRLYDRQLVETCTRLIEERSYVLPEGGWRCPLRTNRPPLPPHRYSSSAVARNSSSVRKSMRARPISHARRTGTLAASNKGIPVERR